MKDEDLPPRNRELLEKAEMVRKPAGELTAEAIGHRLSVDHARGRVRKMLRAQALWPRFLRRGVPLINEEAAARAINAEPWKPLPGW